MKPLLTEEQIRQGIGQLAGKISARYRGETLIIVGILTGSIVLLADLIRRLDLPVRLGFAHASSYRGTARRPDELRLDTKWLPEIAGSHVLLVDDIFDSGRTLSAILGQLRTLEPRSLRSAVLLRKLGRQEVETQPDFVGFDIPDVFVVGYGLDYNGLFRNLPYIAAMESGDVEGEA
ncbi:MAG: hypoxanthine phosphoribosyltransferase [Planctomycetia bacterium]|nr:hypoxanthine phosphoribosyltransferase [Planctomycetia bacterium]